MVLFESALILITVAIVLLHLTRRLSIPYPTVLALAGVAVAALPGAPAIGIDPSLALALFIAPAVFDAAFDFPPRDVRRYWLPLLSLAAIAVVVTTAVVAAVGVAMAGMPLAAAIALGAIVAPPDAAAATAVLGRFSQLPRSTVTVLKGESLLNDAVALLIFSAAVGAMLHPASLGSLAPRLAVAAPGGLLVGCVMGRLGTWVMPLLYGRLSGAVASFVLAFGTWIVAERLELSAVLAMVACGMVVARYAPAHTPARDRIHVYSVWNTAVFLLNVLAFLLLGLQARAVVQRLAPEALGEALRFAGAVLAAVILTRIVWVMLHNVVLRWLYKRRGKRVPTVAQGVLASWCGMRGLVTLATALALPEGFAQRDLIVLSALAVVLGTLVLQGLTLGPLIRLLRFAPDDSLAREVAQARAELIDAGLARIADRRDEAAVRLRELYAAERAAALQGHRPRSTQPIDALKRETLIGKRARLAELRAAGAIDDDVFHTLEHELDWADLAMAPPERFEMDEA
ncbi:MAG: cation:proton antiporter [Rhodocyclaceae bacterium]|nr:cation:proton antiporter [Pseudomonadota bacterium]MDQ7975243.1 cation:proton antiporter [Rhodocyclaceae bacterium]MDQ8002330.1 cation:proton antiporter [Pseudomonadota bacterium]